MTGTVRINKYDNIRGLAIFLIVLGHMSFLVDLRSVNFIHNFIYIIHLPLFFFVAGYFSKIGPDESIKAFKRLFIPFIIFCIIFALFSMVIDGSLPNMLFFKPGYALWFLISLFTMKLLLPIFNRFRYPILTAFILALLIGFFDVDFLGISRTYVFLPIFLIGFYYNDLKERFNKINFFKNKYIIYMLFIVVLCCCAIVAYTVPFNSIILKNQYSSFDIMNILIRGIILILGIAHTLIINKLMTNNKNILTKFGRNSMAIYLLHVYIVIIIRPLMKPYFIHNGGLFILASLLVSFVIVYILSFDIFTKIVNKITDVGFRIVSNFSI